MRYDIILAGVGGQGVLSVASLVAAGALRGGYHVKQSEVHGMAQRGGSVLAHLRMGSRPVHSDIVPVGGADLVLGMEPIEALRHLPYLSAGGAIVTAVEPVRNMASYPDLEGILGKLRSLPKAFLVDAGDLARRAGSPKTVNVVMVGAASHLLPIFPGRLEETIREAFAAKGEETVEMNLRAFRLGREAVEPARAQGPRA
ncbi:MAG: indolepyruvate oxidoreductase subunit beta [Planctomycetaceae bacterium]|nr:indolepyruvate oxidoreductase subunit beta [Planctomycetota bacterium]NUN51476.1 indolepyruvate oxidoreductase subunit beta [Planctomycetaceae bacterium]